MSGIGRRLSGLGCIGLLALAVVGCSPSLSVSNATTFEVRAVVTGEGGTRNVHLVRPGQASIGDIPEGEYSVVVVPDQAWGAAARATRDVLARQLARPGPLAPDQVAAILRELDALHAQIAAFEAEAATDARCSGTVPADGIGAAEVSIGSDGRLVVRCSGGPT
jgi:hypothetical protein